MLMLTSRKQIAGNKEKLESTISRLEALGDTVTEVQIEGDTREMGRRDKLLKYVFKR